MNTLSGRSLLACALVLSRTLLWADVSLTEDAVDNSAGGLPAYRIETPSATYFLEKTGAGLSSILDRDGRDWLSFHPRAGSGSAGEYRGFPNAVHQQAGNYFHPKNEATDLSVTRVEHVGPERVTIASESANGLWAGRFDFFEDHCTFTMTRMPPDKKYWVLYEGTPGGAFDDRGWWATSALREPRPLATEHRDDIPAPEWIAFGVTGTARSLFLLHHEDDPHPDWYYPMRNEMTVFGFGRRGLAKFLDTVPQRFSIGFLETSEPASIDRELRDRFPSVFAAHSETTFPEPGPGDLFREYLWTNEGGDAGGALRVGGRVGYGGGPVPLPHAFDLEHAVRAEIIVEKLLCHDGTRGLEISVNDHDWITVPEAGGIPDPPWAYQHHTYPVVSVPLSQLRSDDGNRFRMRVSDEHPWNWPQNLIYGVHFRIYYDPAVKTHTRGRIRSPKPGAALGREATLQAEISGPNPDIRRVDFLGKYTDVNLEGDGEYTQWHGFFERARLTGHIGSSTNAPWRVSWDTSWVPDQPQPFQIAARIIDQSGLTFFTEPVVGLTLDRPGYSVELCRPYDVPQKWVTRSGEKSEKFRVTGDLDRAVAAQLVWVSWSPGYMHGILVNGQSVFEREGPRYAYYLHRVTLHDLSMFKQGENTLSTALTPRYDGHMVHGMEVNWPGIMVLIRYAQ